MADSQKKILIAEDEKPMAHALELKLKKEGYDARAVFNGESALAAAKETKYDLILSDLVMPKLDGFELLKSLKTAKISTPVVILSNLSQDEDRKKVKELGAKDFFVKSDIPIADIVAHVKKRLG